MQRIRIWLALAGVCAGVAAGSRAQPAPLTLMLVAIVAAGMLAIRRPRAVGASGLLLLGLTAGWLDVSLRAGVAAVETLALEVPMCDVEGQVVEHQGGLGTYLAIERARCRSRFLTGRLGIVVADGTVGDAGGRFEGNGRLVPLTRSRFDSARRKQGASASLRSTDLTFSPPRTPARRIAARVRRGLVEATAEIEPRRAALLRGLTIGDTEDMDRDTTVRFRRSGLTHLVAVSGSNVAIVVGAIALMLAPAGLRTRTAGGIAAIALFVLIVGPEPSVLRAAAMGSIAIAALASGRRAEPLNTLGLALIAVLLWRPGLLSSAGLQLSAGATAGLVLWSGPVAARLEEALPRPLALAAAATLAAQLAVAPILILLFGQLSVIAPLANVLAVPAVPAATILGLASGVIAPLNLTLARILARCAEPFAWWILTVGDTTGGWGWAALEVASGWGWIAGIAVAAIAWTTCSGRDRGRMVRP